MFKSRFLFIAASVAAFVFSAVSCTKDDAQQIFVSSATFKRIDEKTCYLKDSDSTAFIPYELPAGFLPGVSEKRVLVWFTTDGKPLEKGIEGFKDTYLINIEAIDTVYTMEPVQSKGSSQADSLEYGDDLIGVFLDNGITFPYTSVEDGYLCVRFVYYANFYSGAEHRFSLVAGVNPDDPYEVELRHDASGDIFGDQYGGFIAFPLKSLPSTEGVTKKLTLVWKSSLTSNRERFSFDYCSRTDWPVE